MSRGQPSATEDDIEFAYTHHVFYSFYYEIYDYCICKCFNLRLTENNTLRDELRLSESRSCGDEQRVRVHVRISLSTNVYISSTQSQRRGSGNQSWMVDRHQLIVNGCESVFVMMAGRAVIQSTAGEWASQYSNTQ